MATTRTRKPAARKAAAGTRKAAAAKKAPARKAPAKRKLRHEAELPSPAPASGNEVATSATSSSAISPPTRAGT